MDYKALCAFGDADLDVGHFDGEEMPMRLVLMPTQKQYHGNLCSS